MSTHPCSRMYHSCSFPTPSCQGLDIAIQVQTEEEQRRATHQIAAQRYCLASEEHSEQCAAANTKSLEQARCTLHLSFSCLGCVCDGTKSQRVIWLGSTNKNILLQVMVSLVSDLSAM